MEWLTVTGKQRCELPVTFDYDYQNRNLKETDSAAGTESSHY